MCFNQRQAKRDAEAAARRQVAIQEAAARQEADQKKQAALAAAQSISNQQAREAAAQSASEALATPTESADIVLDGTKEETVAAVNRKRRAAYGTEYTSGVQI